MEQLRQNDVGQCVTPLGNVIQGICSLRSLSCPVRTPSHSVGFDCYFRQSCAELHRATLADVREDMSACSRSTVIRNNKVETGQALRCCNIAQLRL
jgi:hypothetical protein